MHDILIVITRALAIISMINTLFCICIKTKNYFSKSKFIMVSTFIFVVLLIISIECSVIVVMCDFVKNSVIDCDMSHVVLYFVICGATDFIISLIMLLVVLYNVRFQDDYIIISKGFRPKKIISILDIDKQKSEYIVYNHKSKFKNFVLLNHDEYVVLFHKNGDKTKIGLNFFLYTEKNIETLQYFVFDLKLKTREIN